MEVCSLLFSTKSQTEQQQPFVVGLNRTTEEKAGAGKLLN